MEPFASVTDVITPSGKNYTAEDQTRICKILGLISSELRFEAHEVGKDLDEMIAADASGSYGDVVKLVTVDIVVRAMRQNFEGEPMTQESQSALGYSWSGTTTIAGGGIAAAILKNDLKCLGLRKQRFGWIHPYDWRGPNE